MPGPSSTDRPPRRELPFPSSAGRRTLRPRYASLFDAKLIDECARLAVQLSAYAIAWKPSETLMPGPELDALDMQLSEMHSSCRKLLQSISSFQATTTTGKKAKAEALAAYIDAMSSLDSPELDAARSLAADLLD